MSKTLLAALLLGTATIVAGPIACTQGADVAATPGTELGIEKDWMETSVKPGDDFYAYANGNWMKTTEIPADRSNTGGFVMSFNQTEKQLEALIKDIVKSDAGDDTPQGRIRNFYQSYLDTAAIEKAGLAPIKPDLDRYARILDKSVLSEVLGSQVRADVDPLNATNFFTENLFGIFVTQALSGKDVVPYILQGGLGLPEREYYLSGDPEMAKIRTAYQKYIEDILTAAGDKDAKAKAKSDLRSRNQDRQGPCDPRGERGLHQVRHAVDPRRPRKECAGDRLGRIPRCRAAWHPGQVRRLSPGRDHRAFRAGRVRAARCVERLARVPPDQQECRRAADEVRPAQLRFQRHPAVRHSRAAPARKARAGGGRMPSSATISARSMSRNISRPRTRRRSKASSATSRMPSAPV